MCRIIEEGEVVNFREIGKQSHLNWSLTQDWREETTLSELISEGTNKFKHATLKWNGILLILLNKIVLKRTIHVDKENDSCWFYESLIYTSFVIFKYFPLLFFYLVNPWNPKFLVVLPLKRPKRKTEYRVWSSTSSVVSSLLLYVFVLFGVILRKKEIGFLYLPRWIFLSSENLLLTRRGRFLYSGFFGHRSGGRYARFRFDPREGSVILLEVWGYGRWRRGVTNLP